MTYDDWRPRYAALAKTWNKPPTNAEQCSAYFEVLSGYPIGIIDQAIVKANGEARYMPPPGAIRELATGLLRGATVYEEARCERCGGNGWIDAPDEAHFNRTYTNYVQRCPQCRPAHVKASAA